MESIKSILEEVVNDNLNESVDFNNITGEVDDLLKGFVLQKSLSKSSGIEKVNFTVKYDGLTKIRLGRNPDYAAHKYNIKLAFEIEDTEKWKFNEQHYVHSNINFYIDTFENNITDAFITDSHGRVFKFPYKARGIKINTLKANMFKFINSSFKGLR